MDIQSLEKRFVRLWTRVRARGDPHKAFKLVLDKYSEPCREYHNLNHVVGCLIIFDQVRHICRKPCLVEFAIWFHDIIYDPRALDNEDRSAELVA